MPKWRTNVFTIVVVLVSTITSRLAADDVRREPSLEERLNRLCERLDEQREKMHVPGIAIAVVKDDKVVLARGLGMRDLENAVAADEHTIFAVGSTTKAFTAALIAMLVDEGKMSWEDHPSEYLPGFRIHDDEANEKLTIRDTLCHRSGLARTDLLWASGRADRQTILKAIADAEPIVPYGTAFHYNNIMYLAAGEVSARVAGVDWDTLLRERLLDPLGMKRSNSSIRDAKNDPLLAHGYEWDEERKAFKLKPMRPIDNVAPAGAINSSATDMAQWVRLMLGRGAIDGKRLLSEDRMDELWSPCMTVMPSMEYALGWFVREWQGKKLIEHGGNIDGFSAQVALLPDDGVGFVLLMNISHTPLQQASIGIVFESLVGEWTDGAPQESIDFTPYLGEYRFDVMDTDLKVLVRNNALAIDVPGQMVFELKPPDADGKWVFAITDQIAVSFMRDDEGEVIGFKFYQAGLELEAYRKGLERPFEVDMDAVAPLLGEYDWAQASAKMRVLVQNGRLAVDVPKQMIYELHTPDDEGRWVFRATKDIWVQFDKDDEGRIVGMTMTQGGVATKLPRLPDVEPTQFKTAAEIEAMMRTYHGVDRLASLTNLRMTGTIRMVNQGLQGTFEAICLGTKQFRVSMDMGVFGHIQMGVVDETYWSESAFQPYEELLGEQQDSVRLQHPLAMFRPWNEFETVRVLPDAEVGGVRTHTVELTRGRTKRILSMDVETGRMVKEIATVPVPGIGRLSTETLLADYREVGGVLMPFHIETQNDLSGRTVIVMDAMDVNVSLGGDALAPLKAEPLP
ncbi:MAG TPA: serine hydrolase [Phycisphaerales bacterium]|nr:serine hydrolase [Phycisphaerales bacterium]HRQ75138.1 serine hydrolase [Phycisphaerales bacterium]